MKHFSEFKLPDLILYPVSKRKKDVGYTSESDNILTFDIEVSSCWWDGKKIISYEKYKSEEYWNNLEPHSICYIWQFSFDDIVYYGRELKDFEIILKQLPAEVHFIIYIHNLAYEFAFLNNYLSPWINVFARTARKPMKAISEKYPNIEFRCSYNLTRTSLEMWGKEIGCYKDTPIDYLKLRTPLTKLTEEELHYAEQDCIVVYQGILIFRKRYKHIKDIPLTQTGEVRRVVKARMLTDSNGKRFRSSKQNPYVKLIPRNFEEYKRMKLTYAGGYCHSNYTLTGYTINDVECYDFCSSYPTALIAFKYPMTPFVECTDVFETVKFNEYAMIICITFYNLKSKLFNHYISKSKSFNIINGKFDNGRVIEADELTIWITEIDLMIIQEAYNYTYKVNEAYKSYKTYLPRNFTNYILELYANKTQYKGFPDGTVEYELYVTSKSRLNSLYGLCCTDLIMDVINFDGNEWTTEYKSIEDINKYLDELIHNNKSRTFNSYPWGIWCCAYGRMTLWKNLIPHDSEVIYCDTDSLKLKGHHNFDDYNEWITGKLREACYYMGLDFEKTRPCDSKGIPHPLGIFEKEETCEEFKTLHSKCYCVRHEGSDHLEMTVAGINKAAVSCLNNNIENFNDETVFDKDAPGVKKQYVVYLDNQIPRIYPDGYESNEQYGINMRPMGYALNITEEYSLLLTMNKLNRLEIFDIWEFGV